LRQTRQPTADAICLAGTARLSALRRLQHLVQAVDVYGPAVDAKTPAAPSAWEFHLPSARLTLMLSPQPYRGFSGEGALLLALSQADQSDARTLAALLAWEAAIDTDAVAGETGLSAPRVERALQVLATSGQVGFDLHERQHFHRVLPFVESRLQQNYPRLDAARELVAAGAVLRGDDALRWRVQGSTQTHVVRLDLDPPRCTCTYWIRHQGKRGPCKHVLAARLVADPAA
jgi:SWIM zinc finger